MHTLVQQYLFENRLFFRNKMNVFWNYIFPLFFLLLFGSLNFGGSIDYVLPGIIIMAIASSCLISTGISFVLMREKGYYRRMSIVPVSRFFLLGTQILQRYVVVLTQIVFLNLVALIVFSASPAYFGLDVWLLVSFGIFTFLALGFLAANISPNVEAAEAFTMLPFFTLLFLGGAFWPLSIMPEFLQKFAVFLPTPYLIGGIQSIVMIDASIFDLGKNILVLIAWGAVSLIMAVKFFRWE
ncbi:MAG TPA: ABC transporter permease [Bacteroidetes bacterium]|nr:ABC transporter permease [Bacteroidota bacterium]